MTTHNASRLDWYQLQNSVQIYESGFKEVDINFPFTGLEISVNLENDDFYERPKISKELEKFKFKVINSNAIFHFVRRFISILDEFSETPIKKNKLLTIFPNITGENLDIEQWGGQYYLYHGISQFTPSIYDFVIELYLILNLYEDNSYTKYKMIECILKIIDWNVPFPQSIIDEIKKIIFNKECITEQIHNVSKLLFQILYMGHKTNAITDNMILGNICMIYSLNYYKMMDEQK